MKYLTMQAGDITVELSGFHDGTNSHIDASHDEQGPLLIVGTMLEDEGFSVKVRPGPAHSATGAIPFYCLNAIKQDEQI